MVTVRFEGVVKRFGRQKVLAGVSGELRPGRVLVVAGPNGAGKSTLLCILAGLLRPSAGDVRYLKGDEVLPREAWYPLLGVAAPDMALYEELSALENLRLFARLRCCHEGDEPLGAALEEVGLAATHHHKLVGTFSSGMRQRAKLAQAVLHRPAVLLLDEPSANLDEDGHRRVGTLLERLKPATAIAVATNDPREMAWGDEKIELAG
ncbi:MAG TPA: ABC transporter ATP-binding protein [Thermoanaerobaculaceae bacterium]|nr:ABC transporter ATP-binding protein [Thermoanaerobaculaceae bacterium]HRS17261.1 ABC transporter ATP-binding protein [Thermoanaerobaculaceae bacterium]